MIIPTLLYDDRNSELFKIVVDEMHRQGIEQYKFQSPIICNSIVKSINISQKAIVQKAKERGDKECCILEDDIWFPADDGWQYFLKNKPEDYDIYIGGSYLQDNRIEYISPVTKVSEYVGNHCIIIHEKYYDKFLSVDDNLHIDTAQKGLGDFYLCYPMPALQRAGKSANNGFQEVNYNSVLKEEAIYGRIHNV